MIVFVGRNDYANVGAVFCKSLEKVGVPAYVFSKYPTLYPITSTEHGDESATVFGDSLEMVEERARDASVVIWLQSVQFPLEIDYTDKKIAVFHGGTRYRRNYRGCNRSFNKTVDVSLIQTADMLGLGAKNEVYMLPAAYISDIKPILEPNDPLVVGHFPSRSSHKGSDLINGVMKRYKDKVDYRFEVKTVSWEQNLKRMNDCDIYIESLNWSSPSTNKHDWSVAALEAAALGDIVITNFPFGIERYKKEYGDYALQVADTRRGLTAIMNRILEMDKSSLTALKHQTIGWAMTTHGLESTGQRLKEALGI